MLQLALWAREQVLSAPTSFLQNQEAVLEVSVQRPGFRTMALRPHIFCSAESPTTQHLHSGPVCLLTSHSSGVLLLFPEDARAAAASRFFSFFKRFFSCFSSFLAISAAASSAWPKKSAVKALKTSGPPEASLLAAPDQAH